MITTYETKSTVAKLIKIVLEEKLHNSDINGSVIISDFDNCREQGYVFELTKINNDYLFNDRIFYAFSEYRNLDNIVVYKGTGSYNFDTLSDDFWNSAKMFNPDEVYKAADYIFKDMTSVIEAMIK